MPPCWLLLEPELPPCVSCCGKGDSLPPPAGVDGWLVPVLPPGVDGNGDGIEGEEEPEGDGMVGGDGIDGVCVDVLTAQPATPSAKAMGQTRPRT